MKVAFPLLIKKLQCFSEIAASPNEVFNGTDFCINCQTFSCVLSIGFLKVLPPVFIFDGFDISFFFFKKFISLSISLFSFSMPLKEALR